MTDHRTSLVFFGNERLATGVSTAAPTLRKLIQDGYHVAAVVSNFEKALSRNARQLEIKQVAEEYGIPVLLPGRLADISSQLEDYKAEAGVLVAYGKIIPETIINIFPKGIVNIHPSLLPLHRGPTPIESVILNGDSQTGVSLMQLVQQMDAGPVYAQESLALAGTETKQQLADKLLELGGDMLIRCLPAILEGGLSPAPQNGDEATYDALVAKEDGIIDWKKPAAQIEREVRAYAEWPKSRAVLGEIDVVITATSVVNKQIENPGSLHIENRKLFVGCGQDSLSIERLKPAGKAEMTADAFLAGYGQNLA